MNQRKIIHIDMDCFYAAVEERDNPELRGRAVAVGGLSEGRGVISAANYEARKYGVRSALSSVVALRQCPHLVLVRPDIQKYKEESQKIHAILQKYTKQIEPLSLDEAYLDVTDSPYFQGSATLLAEQIRKEIHDVTGLTASAGIAPNKFLAKVASDWNKPDGQFVISPGRVDAFVAALPVEKIWGVGKVTARRIHQMGISTCGEMQRLSRLQLKNEFGKFGDFLYAICRGVDHREVHSSRERKSLSVERTFGEDLASLEECLERAPRIHEEFQKRLGRFLARSEKGISTEGVKPESGTPLPENPARKFKSGFVKIKFSDFSVTTLERALESLDFSVFAQLLGEAFGRKEIPVRLIGFGVRFRGNRSTPAEGETGQLLLFSPEG